MQGQKRTFEHNVTVPGGVITQDGFVPYKPHPEFEFLMPVMVSQETKNHHGICKPYVVGGYTMWAMPGGYVYPCREPVAAHRPSRGDMRLDAASHAQSQAA